MSIKENIIINSSSNLSGKKNKLRIWENDASPLPLAYDSDFDETRVVLHANKEDRKIKKTVKEGTRIHACGIKNFDRAVQNTKDLGARAVVFNLSYRIPHSVDADDTINALDGGGSALDLFAPHDQGLLSMGYSEFTGIYFSNVDGPGIADAIINEMERPSTNIIIVDNSPHGVVLSRFVANVVAQKLKLRKKNVPKLPLPQDPVYKLSLKMSGKAKSEAAMRQIATDHYYQTIQWI